MSYTSSINLEWFPYMCKKKNNEIWLLLLYNKENHSLSWPGKAHRSRFALGRSLQVPVLPHWDVSWKVMPIRHQAQNPYKTPTTPQNPSKAVTEKLFLNASNSLSCLHLLSLCHCNPTTQYCLEHDILPLDGISTFHRNVNHTADTSWFVITT